MPKWTQNVSTSAQKCKLHFWSVWLQHVFGLFSASRRFQNKFDPSKGFSTLQGIDVYKSFFHENQVPKSYHYFYIKKRPASHRAAQNVYTFSSPGSEGFRSSTTLLLFAAPSPTSSLIIPSRVRPYSTWLVIYSSFCAPTGVKKQAENSKNRTAVYTHR